jgi:hypothetical protein
MGLGVGIGVGAFMEGLQRGRSFGVMMDEKKYEREQRDRVRGQQKELDEFDTSARAEFDQKVASGEQKPGDVADFLVRYKGPERAALLIGQGDYKGAKDWTDWYESEAARKGSRMFGSALLKAQAGDLVGAIDNAVEAGKVKGYLDHSYSLAGREALPDGSGFRVKLRDGDGAELVWDVTRDNVEQGLTQLFNPEAAYESRLAAKQARDKADLEVETFGRKEGIKAGHDRSLESLKHTLKLKEGSVGQMPAEVKAAEWLANNIAESEGRTATAKDKVEAHRTIRQARDNPNARAKMIIDLVKATKSNPMTGDRPQDEIVSEATELVDTLIAAEDEADDAADDNDGVPRPRPVAPGVEAADTGTEANPYRPTTDEEYAKIPSGAIFFDPDDQTLMRKP